MPGSNSRPNVSEGYEVPLSYRGDRLSPLISFCRVNTLRTTESSLVESLQPRLLPIIGKQKISPDETVLVFYTNTFEAVTSFSSHERIFYRTRWNTIKLGKYSVPSRVRTQDGLDGGSQVAQDSLQHFQPRSRAVPNSTCGELMLLRKASKARFS